MPGTAFNILSFTELARDPEGFFSIKYVDPWFISPISKLWRSDTIHERKYISS